MYKSEKKCPLIQLEENIGQYIYEISGRKDLDVTTQEEAVT